MNAVQHQLFVDDEVIQSCNNLRREYRCPQRYGAVVAPDKSWELSSVIAFGSVLKDAASGKLRLWYTTFSGQRGIGRDILYAESADGIRWEKPSLGRVDHKGAKDNNIVLAAQHPAYPDCANVVCDTTAKNPKRRFMMSCCKRDGNNENPGIWVNFSPDGLAWGDWIGPVLREYGDRNTLMFDPSLDRKHVIFTRPPGMMQTFWKRLVVRLDSKDMLRWKRSDTLLKPDLQDPLDMQFYSMVACRYESLYLGFLQRLHSMEDTLDVELVTSRDSVLWRRNSQRTAFMESNFEKPMQSKWIGLTTNPPIEINGQLLLFYEARNACHSVGGSTVLPYGAICLATIWKDRFASVSAGFVPGELLTKSFACPGGMLFVNANTANHVGCTESADDGEGLKVEVLDESFSPIPAYRVQDIAPLKGDFKTGAVVQWKNRKDLNRVKGQRIRLRFRLMHADLYSFWFDTKAGFPGDSNKPGTLVR